MATIVLVHGSWFGAWCWDRTAPALRAAGHDVHADDLPGHGRDATPVGSCTLAAYVDRVCDQLDALPGPAVLVGHSMGGIVISGVAERLPGKVAELVYLAAYLLRDGESIQSISSSVPGAGSLVRGHMVPADDWSTVAIREEGLRETFFADAARADVSRAAQLLRPEPTAAFRTPVRLTAARSGSVPRTYVRTTRDRALTPPLQDAMLAATPCHRVIDVETSHCPMLSAPDRLAAILQDVAR